MMEGYDKLDLGAWSTIKNVGRIAADPTSWIGLGTLGAGTVAAQGGKIAAKAGIKALIKNRTFKAGAIGAGEAGAYTAADDLGRQETENPDADYDFGRGAKAFGTGAVLGGAIGGTVGRWAQKSRLKKGKADTQDYLDEYSLQNTRNKRAGEIRRVQADNKAIGEATPGWIAKESDKAADLVEKIPFVGPPVAGVFRGLKNRIAVPPATKESLTRDTSNYIKAGVAKASGTRLLGAGAAGLAQQAAGNSLIKSLGASGVNLLTGIGKARWGKKAWNQLRQPTQIKARKLAKQEGPLNRNKTYDELVGDAQAAYRRQDEGARGLQDSPYVWPVKDAEGVPGAGGFISGPQKNLTVAGARQQGVNPLNVENALKAVRENPGLGPEDLLKKIKNGTATPKDKVKYKLNTDGTVSVKDVKLTKVQLSDVKSGKSTVRVNKKTGEVSVCPK